MNNRHHTTKRSETRQGEFYDRVYTKGHSHDNKNSNFIMYLWDRLRMKWKVFGNETQICYKNYHSRWVLQNVPGSVLDIGCGPGSYYHIWVAQNCGSYTGIELSSEAVRLFREAIRKNNLSNAKVILVDFLKNDFPDNSFDMIYASGVLHHFRDLNHACVEMFRVLKPGGIVVTFDPLNTFLYIRILRSLYRPFQLDSAWELPFSRTTFAIFEKFFYIERLHGISGMSNYSFLLSFIPGFSFLAKRILVLGQEYDAKYAIKKSSALWRCLRVAMLLRSKK